MPSCHTCKHDKTSSTKCLACSGPADMASHKGKTHVSFNSTRPGAAESPSTVEASLERNDPTPAELAAQAIDGPDPKVAILPDTLDDCCRIAVYAVLQALRSEEDVSMIRHMLGGGNPTTWAREAGMSKSSGARKWKELRSRWPAS